MILLPQRHAAAIFYFRCHHVFRQISIPPSVIQADSAPARYAAEAKRTMALPLCSSGNG